MDIPQTTPPEAYELLQQHPDAVYLDVRTAPEVSRGTISGALHIELSTLPCVQ